MISLKGLREVGRERSLKAREAEIRDGKGVLQYVCWTEKNRWDAAEEVIIRSSSQLGGLRTEQCPLLHTVVHFCSHIIGALTVTLYFNPSALSTRRHSTLVIYSWSMNCA